MTAVSQIDVAAAPGADESPRSAVSWPAVLAGAAVAAAVSLVLLALGAGLGFAAASPWPGGAPSPTAFAIGTGLWLIVMQWLSSAAGGYLTGRLRTRWAGTHDDEVFFRDTAHGFLTWAVATLLVAGVAAGVGASTAAAGAGAAGNTASYAADTLLRSTRTDDNNGSAAGMRAEVGRVLARSAAEGGVSAEDRSYLASVVAARTGVAPADAQARVEAALTSVREGADKARKASSATAFFTALSLVIGAFIASVAAALGGRQRDEA